MCWLSVGGVGLSMFFRKDNVVGVRCWLGGNPLVSMGVDLQCCRIRWKGYGFHRVCDVSDGGLLHSRGQM